MLTPDKTIRPVEIQSNIPDAGIGYVAIPDVEELDIEQYIADCYRTHTVTLYGGVHNGYFYNVSVDLSTMQAIKFPKNKGEVGSPVVWVKIKPWNKPIIVAILKYDDEYINTGQDELNIIKTSDGNSIDFSVRAKESTVDLSITSKAGNNPQLNINLISPDDAAKLDIFVKGKVKIHTVDDLELVTDKKVSISVVDDENTTKTELYIKTNELHYKDENNEIIVNKDAIKLVADKKIIHNNDDESAVLGDTLESILTDLINAIEALTVQTAVGPSSPPINIATFAQIKSKLKTIKSKKSFLC